MSALNDVLNLVRLNVSVYHNARVCGDWRIDEHELGATCFHLPTQGDCLLTVPEYGEWRLNCGDLVIFPRELVHSMTPADTLIGDQCHLPIAESQDLAGTSMLCGSVRLMHRGSKYLLDTLPPVMVIQEENARPWLGALTKLILDESLRSASLHSPILNRLSELLFSYALQCYTEKFEHEQGLLALYTHPKLAPALRAIHDQPASPWQLASLAAECAISRTQFSKLFSNVAGNTAMQYLTWWRMQLAWSQLSNGDSVEQVAEAVGYRSSAAFSRAFKTEFGETVGVVRSQSR